MNESQRMAEHITQTIAESETIPAAPVPPTMPDENAAALPPAQPVIRYATDAEVDAAMKKIFEKHDRLFAALAK